MLGWGLFFTLALVAGLFFFFALMDATRHDTRTAGYIGLGWIVSIPIVVSAVIRLHEAEKPRVIDTYLWNRNRTRGRLTLLVTVSIWILTGFAVLLHAWL